MHEKVGQDVICFACDECDNRDRDQIVALRHWLGCIIQFSLQKSN